MWHGWKTENSFVRKRNVSILWMNRFLFVLGAHLYVVCLSWLANIGLKIRTEGASFVSLIDAAHSIDKCEMNETGKALAENTDGMLSVQTAVAYITGVFKCASLKCRRFPPRNILMCWCVRQHQFHQELALLKMSLFTLWITGEELASFGCSIGVNLRFSDTLCICSRSCCPLPGIRPVAERSTRWICRGIPHFSIDWIYAHGGCIV